MSVTQIRGDTQLQNDTLTSDQIGSRTTDLTLYPFADTTTAVKITKADKSTPIITVDTTNNKLLLTNGGITAVFQANSSFGGIDVDDGTGAGGEIDGIQAGGYLVLGSEPGAPTALYLNPTEAHIVTGDGTTRLKLDGTTVDARTQRIINVVDPTSAQDAATKNYVDSISAGLDPKASSRVGTLVNVPGYTTSPDNGELTIPNANATYFPNAGAAVVIDGVTLNTGDRVLVKNQTDPKQNGIYSVADPGVQGTTDAVLNRSTDMDGTPANEVSGGNFTFVEAGTQAGTGWVVVWDGTITLNTDPVNWTQFSSSTSVVYLAGAGMTQTGTSTVTFDVVSSNTGITVNANDIALTLNTVSGLEISTGLRIKTDTTTANTIGTTITSNGAGMKFDANSFADSGSETLALASGVAGDGLALTSGVLSVNVSSTGGLQIVTDNLSIKPDTTTANTIAITTTSNGAGILYSSTNFSESSETLQLKTAGVLYANTNIVTREVPTGAINGSNTSYTLATTYVNGAEQVYLNGLLQNAGGNDYTGNGTTIVFTSAPQTGSVILVTYWKA